MHELTSTQYPLAAPIFAPLAAIHGSLAATLAGAIWLDDLAEPRVGYAVASEGCYLAGDP